MGMMVDSRLFHRREMRTVMANVQAQQTMPVDETVSRQQQQQHCPRRRCRQLLLGQRTSYEASLRMNRQSIAGVKCWSVTAEDECDVRMKAESVMRVASDPI